MQQRATPQSPLVVNVPGRTAAPSRKASASRMENVLLGLVVLLIFTCLVVVFSFVFMYTSVSDRHNKGNHKKQNDDIPVPDYAPETPEEAAARREKMQKLMHHLNEPASDPDSGGNKHDQEQQQQINDKQHPHVDGILVDAERSVPIDSLDAAVHHTAWKVSCVGKRRRSGASASAGGCFMNVELIDARDDKEGELATFRTYIGHGIRRSHRSVPDDSLVPLFLEPQPLTTAVVESASASEKSTVLSSSGAQQQQHIFVDHHNPQHQHDPKKPHHATPSFRWVSPTHRQVSIAVHTSLTDGGGAEAQDAPGTRTTFSFHGTANQQGRGARFFGVGNRGSSMEVPLEQDIRLRNLDLNHYELDPKMSLYGVVPLVYAALRVERPAGKTARGGRFEKHDDVLFAGIFFLNAAAIQLRASARGGEGGTPSLRFSAAGGGMRIFFLHGPTPTQILRQFYELTGPPLFVPHWSLGYHQCRWSYRDQRDVLDTVNRGFLDNKMPADAVWLDIDHTDGKRYFTFDKRKYPNPVRMQERLFSEGGRRLVAINDPHIKVDPNYYVYQQAQAAGYFITKGRNSLDSFTSWCWPGTSSWIDFQSEAVRAWYATLFRYDSYVGSTPTLHVWNDMNEPAILTSDITVRDDAAHLGGTVLHRDVHNSYGFYQTMAAHAGLVDRDLQKSHKMASGVARRPFILTRSFFAGSHRYASVWTGDNQGKYPHLERSFDMVLMLAMSGMQHSGADVGGFFDDVNRDLFGAWFAAGVAYPFFRSHSHEAVRRREPWLETDGGRVARALQTRYRIVSHLYSLFARAHIYGESVLRPLLFAYPELAVSSDAKKYSAANSAEFFFWGNAILFRPFVKEQETAQDASNSVNVCAAAPWLWSEDATSGNKDAPSFVSLCTLEWVNPNTDGGRSCQVRSQLCETPMFQRAGTVVVFNALTPSIKFNSGKDDLENDKRHESVFAAGVTASFPRSTVDTTDAHSPLEVRLALHLENDGRDGDILAYGTHFSDDGESAFTEESPSSKFCMSSWSLHQVGADGLSLCMAPAPEERRELTDTVIGALPTSQPTACYEELQRIKRFVFSVHVEGGASSNSNKALKVSTARPKSSHGGAGDSGREESSRSAKIIKEDSGAHGQTWVIPWERDMWERLPAVNSQWCVEMRSV